MATPDTISILDGATFVVSDAHGDLEAGPDQVHGLFYRDTRFLSRWILTVDGRRPDVLSVENSKYFEAQFFLYPPTGTIYENPYLSLIRKRKVGDGFHEDITVFNHGNERKEVELRLDAGADFADLFEVKDALAKKGELYNEERGDALVLGYRRENFVRETSRDLDLAWLSTFHTRVAAPPTPSPTICVEFSSTTTVAREFGSSSCGGDAAPSSGWIVRGVRGRRVSRQP